MSTRTDVPAKLAPLGEKGSSSEQSAKKDAGLWAATAAIGMAAIHFTPGTGFVRLCAPIVVMLIYARIRYNRAASVEDIDERAARVVQLADSLYFLGFLWTLWALIDTFVLKEMTVPQAVFRIFGYALVTTAAGMFLRLYLLQFQHTAYVEQDIKKELEKLGGTISRATEAFQGLQSPADMAVKDFQAKIDGVITGWSKSLTEGMSALHKNLKTIEADAKNINTNLERIHEASAAELRSSVQEAVKTFVAGLQPPLRKLQDANAEFVENVRDGSKRVVLTMAGGNERINTTLRQFQEKIQSASVDLEKSLTDLGERIRRVRVPEDLVALEVKNQVAQMTAGLRELQKVVREAVASVRDLAAEVSSRPAQPKSFWNKIRDLFP